MLEAEKQYNVNIGHGSIVFKSMLSHESQWSALKNNYEPSASLTSDGYCEVYNVRTAFHILSAQ